MKHIKVKSFAELKDFYPIKQEPGEATIIEISTEEDPMPPWWPERECLPEEWKIQWLEEKDNDIPKSEEKKEEEDEPRN